jgi:hypothetical protein
VLLNAALSEDHSWKEVPYYEKGYMGHKDMARMSTKFED